MKFVAFTSALFLLFVVLTAQPVLSVDTNKGLVAYWDFNENDGDTTIDLTGNGHDGTLIGDPQRVDGYFGGGIEFDQVEDEVRVPFHEDLNPEAFTICAWANVEPGSANHRAVISSRDEPPTSGYIIYAEPEIHGNFGQAMARHPGYLYKGPQLILATGIMSLVFMPMAHKCST